jgi:hypothetical protein
MWSWRAIVLMMPAGDNSWLVYQSSLAILPADTSGASRRNGRSENFAYQFLKYLKGSLTYRKILRHGIFGFSSHPKEGVLRICIALKYPSPRPGLNPRHLGTTPPRVTARKVLTYLLITIIHLLNIFSLTISIISQDASCACVLLTCVSRTADSVKAVWAEFWLFMGSLDTV